MIRPPLRDRLAASLVTFVMKTIASKWYRERVTKAITLGLPQVDRAAAPAFNPDWAKKRGGAA